MGARVARIGWVLLAAAMMLTLQHPLHADDSTVVVDFDESLGEVPDGVTVGPGGTVYFGLYFPSGAIYRLERDGQVELITTVDPLGGAFGMIADTHGNVYVAVPSFDPATHGIWVVPRDGQPPERLAGSDNVVFPNGLALDDRRNLYVTDSLMGALWRIAADGAVEPWAVDPLLAGTDDCFVGPFGADGVAFGEGALLVTNFCKSTVLRVPIAAEGEAGAVELLADGAAFGLASADGIALDVRGNLYVADLVDSKIVRIAPDASHATVIADADDGLDDPAGVTFGAGKDANSLYVTNFTLLGLPAGTQGPALVKITLGEDVRGRLTARPGPYDHR